MGLLVSGLVASLVQLNSAKQGGHFQLCKVGYLEGAVCWHGTGTLFGGVKSGSIKRHQSGQGRLPPPPPPQKKRGIIVILIVVIIVVSSAILWGFGDIELEKGGTPFARSLALKMGFGIG